MLALAPRPPPVLRRSPGRSLHPWPPGAVRALHPTPRTSGPRARPRPREYAPPRVRTPLRPTRPASNPSEPLRTSLPSSPLQDLGSASVAPLRTTPNARRGGPERACPAFSPSSCPSELQERLQLFKSAAIFTAANFPACLALRDRELGPTGNGGRGRRDGWDLWGR
ncbi:proline-rich receptor-like protein kinase PERK2 [Bubalus bubalis]|uniref:proline-rich receptor-like protein kinase PERK2 n=1 Tax=Bubalus bubalis TaxID=89462 RepID=UPI001E1B8EE8|nr:proline-rich receptor-like protein kinase PERK2 [Bubalus bubalis]